MQLIKDISNKGLVWLWVAALLIAGDRFAKIWAMEHLSLFEPLSILPFFNLTLAHNTGAAFNFLHSASGWQHFLFGGLAIVVSAVIFCWLYKLSARERWLSIALCLILGGAIGNAWDRILYGYVIDFFDFHLGRWHFAIFNIADAGICIGAAMLFLHWIIYPAYQPN